METGFAPSRLQRSFDVRSYEVDPDGKLSLVSLVRMLQEVAWLHASQLGKGYADRSAGTRYWVLARLRLRMSRYPSWGDTFTIATYPVGTERLLALREFQIDDADGQLLGYASTGWLILDGSSGRPIRPQDVVQDLAISEARFAADMRKVGRPGDDADDADVGEAYPVRYGEIDQYRHVNNAAYVGWVIDCIAAHIGEDATTGLPTIGEFDIDYLHEMRLEDRWRCRLRLGSPIGDLAGGAVRYRAEIVRERDGVATCRASVTLSSPSAVAPGVQRVPRRPSVSSNMSREAGERE
jgi:medium-chain acyl-[acyl-carrier-protein] hydrolase